MSDYLTRKTEGVQQQLQLSELENSAQKSGTAPQFHKAHVNRGNAELPILQWQRAYGNRAMQHIVHRAGSRPETVSHLISSHLENVINRAQSNGRPLQGDLHTLLEPIYGTSLDHVSLHTDHTAHNLNVILQSRAFTVGRDIFFRRGEYQPETPTGQKLLLHELTHTRQISPQSSSTIRRKPIISFNDKQYDIEDQEQLSALGELIRQTESQEILAAIKASIERDARFYLIGNINDNEEYRRQQNVLSLLRTINIRLRVRSDPYFERLHHVLRDIRVSPFLTELQKYRRLKKFEERIRQEEKMGRIHFPLGMLEKKFRRKRPPFSFFKSYENLVSLVDPEQHEKAIEKMEDVPPLNEGQPLITQDLKGSKQFELLKLLSMILNVPDEEIGFSDLGDRLIAFDKEAIKEKASWTPLFSLSRWQQPSAPFAILDEEGSPIVAEKLAVSVQRADWFIRHLVDESVLAQIKQPIIIVHKENIREFAKENRETGNFEVHICFSTPISTIVHEFGHVIEKQLPEQSIQLLLSFLKKRNTSRLLKILKIEPEEVEMGYAGDFPITGAYTGKFYESDTELTSTTLEFLIKDFDMLIENDPERAALILRILKPSLFENKGDLN